ncbi:MAG TPA: winged helix-turn-helix transcriptional regulator [Solirubrobacteraceae bacterium]
MQHAPPPKRHPYDQWTPDARALDLVGDKWTLLIIRDLAAGPRRFVELQRLLPGISTEQLRSRLNRMVADGMLTRRRFREVPPRVEYELTERARDLMPAIGELARWGYAWTWSAPREGERIDIDAIFRLAPGMARLAHDVRGRLELTITDSRESEPVTLVMTVAAGEVAVEEGRAENADARVTAPTAAWVRAFMPAGDRDGLRIEGDRALAMRLLDGLSPQEYDSERAERVQIA